MYRSNQFCFHVMVAFAGTFAVVQLIEATAGLYAGVSVYVTLPLLIAAMLEGKHHMRLYEEAPSAGQCWKAALGMATITFGLVTFGFLIEFLLVTDPAGLFDGNKNASSWLFVGICALCTVPLLRIGYAIGVTSELRARRLSGQ